MKLDFPTVFPSASVSIIDAIVASSRATESVNISDSDERENFLSDRKAQQDGLFL